MGAQACSPQTPATWVVVSKDGMEARIVLSEASEVPGVEEMRAALADLGVVHGVDESCLRRVASERKPGEYVVARGTPAVPPIDGHVDYFFRTGPRLLTPNLLVDGRVDHHDLGAFDSVEEGQVLARRSPPVPGVPGITVRGEEIPVRLPRDAPLKAGRGTILAEDGLLVLAAHKGQPELHRGLVVVNPNLRIDGDIDYGTGDVSFDGNVEIMGEIKRTFAVRVTGNLYVHGGVEGAILEVGGNLAVEGGIRHGSQVSVGGNMRARYVEYSRVVCDGHLLVHDDLMFTQVECGGTVEVQGGLVGGEVRADVAIRAESLGSRLGTPTELVLRPRAKWASRIREAEAEAADLRERIAEIEMATHEALGRQRGDPDGILAKLHMASDQLRAELAAVTGRLLVARKRYEELGRPKVFVTHVIHPGVRIWLNDAVAKFDDDRLCRELYEEGGDVHIA